VELDLVDNLLLFFAIPRLGYGLFGPDEAGRLSSLQGVEFA
jgi:hypothetical protein